MSDDGGDSDTGELPDQAQGGAAAPGPQDYGDPGESFETGIRPPLRWWQFVQRHRRSRSSRQPVETFEQANRAHHLKVKRSEFNLRRIYAGVLLGAMMIQVGIADYFFWEYLKAYEFRAPESPMIAWLSAGVVQIVGLVFVITKYLFIKPETETSAQPSK